MTSDPDLSGKKAKVALERKKQLKQVESSEKMEK